MLEVCGVGARGQGKFLMTLFAKDKDTVAGHLFIRS
jgi:hypothetical protein